MGSRLLAILLAAYCLIPNTSPGQVLAAVGLAPLAHASTLPHDQAPADGQETPFTEEGETESAAKGLSKFFLPATGEIVCIPPVHHVADRLPLDCRSPQSLLHTSQILQI
jgi:hypothetical protein